MQLIGAGVVQQHRRCCLAVAGRHACKCKRPHDEIQIHRLTLHTVVRAGGAVRRLPHIVGAVVAQLVGKAGDPEIVAPLVEAGIRKAAPHPVQRCIKPLLAGVAVLFQPGEECLGQLGHLGGENAADVLIFQIVVDRVAQLVGRGGVVVQTFLRRSGQAQQPGNVVGLTAGLLHRRRVGVEIGAEGDAQPGTLVSVAPPVGVVLGPVFLLAVPLAAVTAADDGKVDAGGLGLFPVPPRPGTWRRPCP